MSLAQTVDYQPGLPLIPRISPTVFVIDEDASVRRSLEIVIRGAGWQPEVFASAREFLMQPRSAAPCCVILSLSAADPNGSDIQRRIAHECAEIPIIVVSHDGDIPTAVQAIKTGAVDFLLKPIDSNLLLCAIRMSLRRSHTFLNREREMQELRGCYASLTPRERQVMVSVVSGMLNKQIGAKLGISEITVKAHRGQVTQKMKANSIADLVRMGTRLKLPQAGYTTETVAANLLSAWPARQGSVSHSLSAN
jgi:FixJ family two-component response regulator